MGKPDFREGQGKSRVKTGRMSFFQGNQGKLFHFFPERLEAPFLHVLDPNSPSFYVKCPRKCQKTYNFDIFPTLSQIYTSPPPKFWGEF